MNSKPEREISKNVLEFDVNTEYKADLITGMNFSKTDFSFALLLATFEPLEIYQSYIPFWKAQECGNNA